MHIYIFTYNRTQKSSGASRGGTSYSVSYFDYSYCRVWFFFSFSLYNINEMIDNTACIHEIFFLKKKTTKSADSPRNAIRRVST